MNSLDLPLDLVKPGFANYAWMNFGLYLIVACDDYEWNHLSQKKSIR